MGPSQDNLEASPRPDNSPESEGLSSPAFIAMTLGGVAAAIGLLIAVLTFWPSSEQVRAAPLSTQQAAGPSETDSAAAFEEPAIADAENPQFGGAVPKASGDASPEPTPETAEALQVEPPANAEPANPPAGGPSAAAWAKLRECEASGNYAAVNPAGYHGAYQFDQRTWDSTATSAGRADLIGVLPSKAAPADQDALAFALYEQRGAQPWPNCGRHLR